MDACLLVCFPMFAPILVSRLCPTRCLWGLPCFGSLGLDKLSRRLAVGILDTALAALDRRQSKAAGVGPRDGQDTVQ
ncbi:hypothetical protein PF010_g32986 [Phytophthora fragariae]|uniref:Secreted protein n=1 Tax=Phytophthora fragariae TaxID=53985 RepID=A0A6A3PQC7_9STRA|nr:hypothetical protein PF010_g32986 [Phytophthora fragariae]KAE9056009.1 hypothetical protein PF007_g32122 [Phytophthora fragariae]